MSTTNILDLCNRVDELEKKHDSGGTAADTTYDNTDSGLTADTVQGAIDELAGDIDGLSADDIDYDNTDSGLTADTVQGAVDELAGSYPADKVMMSDGVTSVEDALDELTASTSGTYIDITSYNSSANQYACTSDGYVRLATASNGKGLIVINDLQLAGSEQNISYAEWGIFVRKGVKVYLKSGTDASLIFFPYT